ncbi:hypothetical protein EI94DRAFT_806834 [Lactarius quietus]|nr:hypothetical protein EI94DRAFT_806834 [Lactarius quietus]
MEGSPQFVITDKVFHEPRDLLRIYRNGSRETTCERLKDFEISEMLLLEYTVRLAVELGTVAQDHTKAPPSGHGVQDLEKGGDVETLSFSLDAPACFVMHFVEQRKRGFGNPSRLGRSSVFQQKERFEGSSSSFERMALASNVKLTSGPSHRSDRCYFWSSTIIGSSEETSVPS